MQHISYTYGQNHYLLDPELKALLPHFWPEARDHAAELEAWGAYMGGPAYEAGYQVDRRAEPVLVMHDLDGKRVDRVWLDPLERQVLNELRPVMRPPYEGAAGSTTSPLATCSPSPGCIASSPSPTRSPTRSTSTGPNTPTGRGRSSTARPTAPPG